MVPGAASTSRRVRPGRIAPIARIVALAGALLGTADPLRAAEPVVPQRSTVEPAPADPAADFARQVRPFLERHCLACHGPAKQEGGLRLDGPVPDLVEPAAHQRWSAVRRMAASGAMPPEDRPRPAAPELTAALDWIDAAHARAAVVLRGGIGRRALRRLTGREYVATLHDLLGLSFPHGLVDLSERLPSDAAPDRFSNDSTEQTTQPLLLERSLDLAQDLLDVALPGAGTVRPFRYEVDLRAYVGRIAPQSGKPPGYPNAVYAVEIDSALPEGVRASFGLKGRWGGPNNGRRPQAASRCDAERGVLLEPNPTRVGYPEEALVLELPFVPERGVLRVRAVVGARRMAEDTAPVLRVGIERESALVPLASVVVEAPEDAPREVVLDFPLRLAPVDWKGLRRDGRMRIQIDDAAAILAPTPLGTIDPKTKNDAIPLPPRSALVVRSLVVEVPDSATWPPEGSRLLPPPVAGEDERARVVRGLGSFVARAFRRPPESAETESFLALYDAERGRGESFLDAYRTVLAAVLVAPKTYFLVEPKGPERRRLDPHELAARLAYLLGNAPPDAELSARAADGSLSRDDVFAAQFDRLLDDPRSLAFCREFARQWLALDGIRHLGPSFADGRLAGRDRKEDLPWYEAAIRSDLAEEPVRFLHEAFRSGLPVETLADADFAVVNDRLARFYGVEGVAGPEWRRVAAPVGRRGGLLAQAGIVAAASHGRQRAEILRGVYLLERFLGIDVPTPPGNVQPLDVQVVLDRSLEKVVPRRHVERHSTVATCAVCHARIDPLGFAWDEFDLFGRPKRDKSGVLLAVDSSGKLPDGTPFADAAEFRRSIATRTASGPAPFVSAFARRLFAYALGRGLDEGDEALVAGVLADPAASRDLRSLLKALVSSEPFRTK